MIKPLFISMYISHSLSMYVTNPSRSISLHAKYFFAIPTTLKAKLFPVIKGQEIYHFPTGVS